MKEKFSVLPKFVKISIVAVLAFVFMCCCCLITILVIPSPKSSKTETPGAKLSLVTPTNLILISETPILTPIITLTLTPSDTPTDSPTLPPATQTAESVHATAASKAAMATSTAQALIDSRNATATSKAFMSTSTAQAVKDSRTATAQARMATATEIASYVEVYWKDLITYPDNYKGKRVKINGQVFNINSNTELQIWVGNYEAIYVVMKEPFSDLYKNSWVSIYGTVTGTNCGSNAFGGTVCQPLITEAFYVKR